MLECCSLCTSLSPNLYETVKFWAVKATKIIKILDLLRNNDVSNIFVKFQGIGEKITKSMFSPKKNTN